MTRSKRRYRKQSDRRVWVFSELNPNLQPGDLTRLLASAALAEASRRQRRREVWYEEREDSSDAS